MAAQVGAALREDEVRGAGGVDVERNQHGGAARAGNGQPHRGRRVEQGAAQRRREVRARAQATSTCSSKLTSPSSVRWTGHLAPITASRSICSSVRVSGIRVTSRNWVG